IGLRAAYRQWRLSSGLVVVDPNWDAPAEMAPARAPRRQPRAEREFEHPVFVAHRDGRQVGLEITELGLRSVEAVQPDARRQFDPYRPQRFPGDTRAPPVRKAAKIDHVAADPLMAGLRIDLGLPVDTAHQPEAAELKAALQLD